MRAACGAAMPRLPAGDFRRTLEERTPSADSPARGPHGREPPPHDLRIHLVTQPPIDAPSLDSYAMLTDELSLTRITGRLVGVAGQVLEAEMPRAIVGSLVSIETRSGKKLQAEVVGFRESKAILAPLGDIQTVPQRALVVTEPTPLSVKVGPKILGRVLDGLGNPIDGLGPLEAEALYPVNQVPADPLHRQGIHEPFFTGVRAIDGVHPIGKGQRIGLFAGSGVGKSTLMSMIVKKSSADVVVCALVGERNREVRDFVKDTMGPEGMAKSVVIAATSDNPAMVRVKAAFVATAIAEYFRDQGLNVVLLLDSVTRLAMAQREIGLSAGEPPSERGYTPSCFAIMPKIMERAGAGVIGTITAMYTVLVTGDDMNEPIADTARGILDGHMVLSRKLAHNGHYPAIDILQSISRLRGDIAERDHVDAAIKLSSAWSAYEDAKDLIDVGAYVPGSNPDIDYAIQMRKPIQEFLRQRGEEPVSWDDTLAKVKALMGGTPPPVAIQNTPPPAQPAAPAEDAANDAMDWNW
ncbi:MAG: flagellum-specific synthase [Thermoleophilia bacterium]|nr:flagellum-specific synthase [Thermoleophilia bacterium]